MDKWGEMPKIDLYSDGGAEPNPGKGGYGVILSWKGKQRELSQGYKLTTNNRMELLGVIKGLEKLKTKSSVYIYTDSKYVINGMEKGWAEKWRSNNWYRNKKERAVNIDLWSRLLDLSAIHDVKFHWVKGHNGHPENERCDFLATKALQSDNLKDDEGFEEVVQPNETESKSNFSNKKTHKNKITNEGDLCRHCNTPVIKKSSKNKKLKPNQSYYFEYYMFCPNCRKMYMVEDAKRYIGDNPSLF
jgi:ribonuclease HI